jgi:hypothetical protein
VRRGSIAATSVSSFAFSTNRREGEHDGNLRGTAGGHE